MQDAIKELLVKHWRTSTSGLLFLVLKGAAAQWPTHSVILNLLSDVFVGLGLLNAVDAARLMKK